jgi:hypothetical protein
LPFKNDVLLCRMAVHIDLLSGNVYEEVHKVGVPSFRLVKRVGRVNGTLYLFRFDKPVVNEKQEIRFLRLNSVRLA